MESHFGGTVKNKMNFKQATFGAELEIADIDTRLTLPAGNTWDRKDSTICNSSGAANDPLKILNKYGSEIQTRPCNSPEELVEEILWIYKVFHGEYSFNFTTNLHTHIRVPGLRENLKDMQRILKWVQQHGTQMFDLIDPIPKPRDADFDFVSEYKGALKRYRRRLVSHHHQLGPKAYEAALKAKTIEQFRLGHRVSSKGTILPPALTVRAAVNMLQLWETDTIEFRCFTMSDDKLKLYSACCWPYLMLKAVQHNPYPLQ